MAFAFWILGLGVLQLQVMIHLGSVYVGSRLTAKSDWLFTDGQRVVVVRCNSLSTKLYTTQTMRCGGIRRQRFGTVYDVVSTQLLSGCCNVCLGQVLRGAFCVLRVVCRSVCVGVPVGDSVLGCVVPGFRCGGRVRLCRTCEWPR